MGAIRLTTVLGAAAVALILSGCAGSPSSPASPTATRTPSATAAPSATPTPSATPDGTPPPSSDPVATVDALVIRPTGLELRADGAVVATLDYMSSPQAAVAALTRALGSPPADEPYEGSPHFPPGVLHRWDGLVLDERFYDEARRQAEGYDYLVWPRFAVTLQGPAAGAVPVSTVQGHRAGDPWTGVAADPDFDPDLFTCEGTPIEAQDIQTPDGPKRVAVAAAATENGASVRWFRAPALEADGCA